MSSWERNVAGGLALLRRRITGDYEVDEFGFDPDLTEHVLAPALRPLYRRWFRTEVTGIHHIPAEGGALLVANHAGGLWALDGVMTALAVHDEHPAHRFLRMLGADLVFTTPVLGALARKSGSTLACNPDAERLLGEGELVGVWPEGFKGIGKPFSERYKLQRFGRGGFVSAALRARAPIIPVSIVGSEEIHPMLGNAKTLARVARIALLPADSDISLARPARARPVAEQVADRVRRADPDRRIRRRRRRRPDARLRAHRPGARDDPVDALPGARCASFGLALSTERRESDQSMATSRAC